MLRRRVTRYTVFDGTHIGYQVVGEHYFEEWRSSPTYPEERREWFIKNHSFFIE